MVFGYLKPVSGLSHFVVLDVQNAKSARRKMSLAACLISNTKKFLCLDWVILQHPP